MKTLTRLLYFGAPPPDLSGDEGQILSERRQVLLMIADLDDATRKQVEAAAQQASVPMDALYGLLNALGAEAPRDPNRLNAVLKQQTETVKNKLAVLDSLGRQDAEVARLSALADKALAEGAIQANLRFMQAADARQRVIDATLDQTEADLRTSRLASGATKAKLAEAYALNFTFDKAAQAYEEAFLQVQKWDRSTAFDYKLEAAGSLRQHGDERGDNAALLAAIHAYGEAVELMPRETDPANWAATQNNLGIVLQTLGQREGDTARLQEAVATYRAALEERTRERVPLKWAMTQNNLGNALWSLGERESGTTQLEEAAIAYRAALAEFTRERVPLDWAMTQNNLGLVLQSLGQREGNTDRLEASVMAFRAALEVRTRERVPLDWAASQNDLGIALSILGEWESGTVRLEEAVVAFRSSLEERRRERVPLLWAATQNNLGIVLQTLGQREGDTARLQEAVATYRAALEERTRERVPLDWAMTQNNLGNALQTLGKRESGKARLVEAVQAYRAALEEWTLDRSQFGWVMAQGNLGDALQTLAERSTSPRRTAFRLEAIEAWRNAQLFHDRKTRPDIWAWRQNWIGYALVLIGEDDGETARFAEAVPLLREALLAQQQLQSTEAFYTADSLCRALLGTGPGAEGTCHAPGSTGFVPHRY